MTPFIRPAQESDVSIIAQTLRAADRNEIEATTEETPHTRLCFGACQGSTKVGLSNTGRNPVALSHPLAGSYQHRSPMDGCVPPCAGLPYLGSAQQPRKIIETLHQNFPVLHNVVDARNKLHIRWLKWCGFEFTHLHPAWGREKRPFLSFGGIAHELYYGCPQDRTKHCRFGGARQDAKAYNQWAAQKYVRDRAYTRPCAPTTSASTVPTYGKTFGGRWKKRPLLLFDRMTSSVNPGPHEPPLQSPWGSGGSVGVSRLF